MEKTKQFPFHRTGKGIYSLFTDFTVKIPLSPPLTKGEELRFSPFVKGRRKGILLTGVNTAVFMTVAVNLLFPSRLSSFS